MASERTVKVRLTAQVQDYIEGMEKASRATRETGSESEKLAQKRDAMEKMGRTMLIAGGAMATGLVLSTKAAIDWDSAWAGVRKTVDGSDAELAAVESGLRGLTAILPASHTEIAAVAEAAGQLGIETPNVVAFTKTMIDLGETTNLSSEQAAMSLARFMNIMGTSQDDVAKLGSALVGLGNNFATTESEILEMSMRLSKSGVQIGLTEGEVLGLATALSSVGIEAEAGGSAMSKVMIDIASSVEEGGSRVEMFAKTAGMSADQFAAKWKSEPAAALAAFVKGLANAEAQGGSTLGVLAELGITEVRMRDALLGSAAAADKFADAMAMGNEEFEANNALTNEAEKRYETTQAQLAIMGNRVMDAAISLGEHFLPALELVAEGIGTFADMLGNLDGPMGAVVAWGTLIASGILLTGGAALIAVPQIAAYKVALETLGYTGRGLKTALSSISSFVLSPTGLIAGFTLAAIASMGLNNAMKASTTTAGEFETAMKRKISLSEAMVAKAEQESSWAYNAAEAYENLGGALDKAAANQSEFSRWWFGLNYGEQGAIDSIKEMGVALAGLAKTDMSEASRQFQMFGKDFDLTREQMAAAINEMPDFKDALIDVALGAGLATDDSTLLKIAMAELGPAAKKAAEGTKDSADTLAELEGKAVSTEGAIDSLADTIRGFGSAELDARAAARELEAAYDDLTASLEANGATLDITTQQGRDNEAAIDSVAKATLEAAAATLEQTGDQEQANAVLAAGREQLIQMIQPLVGSRDAAEAYANKLGLIPENVSTGVALYGVAAAEEALNNLVRDRIASIEVRANMPDLNGSGSGGGRPGIAVGGLFSYANGGMNDHVQAFAGGTGIYSGRAGSLYKFAEPETGWEAFISGKPSERDRNRQIWADAGERLGVNAQQGNQISIVVQPAPGMDEEALADRVVRKIEGML